MKRPEKYLAAIGLAFVVAACGNSETETPATVAQAAVSAAPSAPIVLDQFGYRPNDAKIVGIRQPVDGFDSGAGSAPRATYYVRRAGSKEMVSTFALDANEDAPVDPLSGDRVWTLDITRITEPGEYFITSDDDVQVSPTFTIGKNVYKPVLREAFRTFYYQRAGIAKSGPEAGTDWSDAASHLGRKQDREARLFSAPDDKSTERDLRGGWFDAGDYNQYTNWTADQCRTLLISYTENPDAWGDDFGIPESGNGVSDLLDEAKWGLDWLLRMQGPDGSVLSILDRDHASPPSAAKGPSLYGPPTTAATLSAAGTFAFASTVFSASGAPGHAAYAADLKKAALAAWEWAEANPGVTFYNNDARDSSEGIGAGQQEPEEEYLVGKRFAAAAYLHMLTGDPDLLPVLDAAFAETEMLKTGFVDAYRYEIQDAALMLARQPDAPAEMRSYYAEIFGRRFEAAPSGGYDVPLDAIHWGSNGTMARTGLLYVDGVRLSDNPKVAARYLAKARDYLHYLHGANPMGKVYLTNMAAFGAEQSVMRLYHTWTTATPIPGYLIGGPNPTYSWDGCCPETCGSAGSNEACGAAQPSPPGGQPPLKSYLDFNDGWPLNSWQISENSISYQAPYLRLLANFVE